MTTFAKKVSACARISWLASMLAAAFLAGCGDGGPKSEAASKTLPESMVRVAISEDLPTLDPHLHLSHVGYAVLGNIFEPLVCRDPENQSIGCLAESWEHEDFTRWRFALRSGARFHDDRSVTMQDVLFSLDRARTHPESEVRGFMIGVQSFAGDEKSGTVEIVLQRADSFFLDSLTYISIVPADSPDVITEPIGSGPYRLAAYEPGVSVRLSVFEDHWSTAEGLLPGEFLIETRAEEAVKHLEAGRVDLVDSLPPRLVEQVESHPELWVESRLGQAVIFLTLNPGIEPLADPRVRRAIDLGVDREALMRQVTLNHSRPASQMATPSIFGHNPNLEPTRRDVARARDVLRSTGLELPVALRLETTEPFSEYGEKLAAQLAEVGFEVEIVLRLWPELYKDLFAQRVGLWLGFWFFDSPDSAIFFAATEHSKTEGGDLGSSVITQFDDPELDILIVTAAEERDLARREERLQEISRRVTERNIQMPLLWPLDLYGTRRSFQWQARMDNGLFLREMKKGEI